MRANITVYWMRPLLQYNRKPSRFRLVPETNYEDADNNNFLESFFFFRFRVECAVKVLRIRPQNQRLHIYSSILYLIQFPKLFLLFYFISFRKGNGSLALNWHRTSEHITQTGYKNILIKRWRCVNSHYDDFFFCFGKNGASTMVRFACRQDLWNVDSQWLDVVTIVKYCRRTEMLDSHHENVYVRPMKCSLICF